MCIVTIVTHLQSFSFYVYVGYVSCHFSINTLSIGFVYEESISVSRLCFYLPPDSLCLRVRLSDLTKFYISGPIKICMPGQSISNFYYSSLFTIATVVLTIIMYFLLYSGFFPRLIAKLLRTFCYVMHISSANQNFLVLLLTISFLVNQITIHHKTILPLSGWYSLWVTRIVMSSHVLILC